VDVDEDRCWVIRVKVGGVTGLVESRRLWMDGGGFSEGMGDE
jgi:hypothetical protein